jgi:hypothetical protein
MLNALQGIKQEDVNSMIVLHQCTCGCSLALLPVDEHITNE